jgi:PRTRC genetic system ThiF family protein
MKPKIHYIHPYVISPGELLTIFLVGGGGTGSHVLSGLAAINKSLIALDHPGIHVTLFDDDTISETNVGRQLFFESDIGQKKANVLISRINRSFGFDWKAKAMKYNVDMTDNDRKFSANIIITCVDSIKSRVEVDEFLKEVSSNRRSYTDDTKFYYQIDCGNSANSGQIFVGSNGSIKQPGSKQFEPVFDLGNTRWHFNGVKDEPNTPSCSTAEALFKQNLFVNKIIATYCCHILWTMLREHRLTHKGVYINLQTLNTNPRNL